MAQNYNLQQGAINGVAPRDITFPIPEEGEVFRDLGNNQIMYMKGGQVYQLPSAVDTFSQEQRNEWGRGGYNLERMQQLANEQFLQQAGVDYGGDVNKFISGLRTQNIGDLQTAGLVKAQNQQLQFGEATPEQFKSIYDAYKTKVFGPTQAPTETLTGPGAQTYKDVPKQPATPVVPQTTQPVAGATAQQPQGTVYTIQPGDTLSAIAQRNGTTIQALMVANPNITDPNKIYAGTNLTIPGATAQGQQQQTDTRKYIQDPNNPNASIPNPNYNKPISGQTGASEGGLWDDPEIKTGLKELNGETDYLEGVDELSEEEPEDPTAFRDKIYNAYGIDILTKNWEDTPVKSFEEVWQGIYDVLGLNDFKIQLDDIRKKIDKADKDFAEAMGEAYDNPWFSHSMLLGTQGKIREAYEMTSSRLNNQYTLLLSAYNSGKEEASSVATKTINALSETKDWAKEKLDFYVKEAEKVISAQKAEEKDKPTSYEEWDLAGKKAGTGMTYADWLRKGETGKLTTEEKEAQRVKDIKGFMNSKKGADQKISWETYAEAAQRWIGSGGNTTDFKVCFPPEILMDEPNIEALPSVLKPSVDVGLYGVYNTVPPPVK